MSLGVASHIYWRTAHAFVSSEREVWFLGRDDLGSRIY